MKVLHLISSGGMYGAEAIILNLLHSQSQMGHPGTLGVFQTSPDTTPELHQVALAQGLDSHLIPCRGQLDLAVPARLRELVRRTEADVVHAHGYKTDIYAWLALRTGRVALISTCHTWYDNNRMLSLYGALDRRVLRSFARVVAVSAAVQQRLLDSGVSRNKVEIIGNGVDLNRFDNVPASLLPSFCPAECPLIGLIGRLSVEKGVDLFITAAEVVLRSFPSARFVVVGDGPDRQALQALIDHQQLTDRVILLGKRTDMPAVFASLTILVSASRLEGLPVALLEGMASRLPVVATSVGAVPTIIHDGATGLLVPPENVAALAAAITTLLQNPQERHRLGAGARLLVEHEYSAQRMTADYFCLYREALQTRRA